MTKKLEKERFFFNIKEIGREILPKNKNEIFLFLICLLVYFSFSIIIALKTQLIEGIPGIKADLYLGFDNNSVFNRGTSNELTHPLLKIFTKPLMYIGTFCSLIFSSSKGKVIFISIFCNCLLSLTILYIYKYLKNIIKLNGYILYLITFFFMFFSSNIYLSFTFESFTISIFILSFFIYYYSLKIKTNQSVSLSINVILALILGGITITNFIKGLIPIFLLENKKETIRRVVIASLLAITTYILIKFIQGGINYYHYINYIQSFTGNNNIPFYKSAIDLFLGSAILTPQFKVLFSRDFGHAMILFDYYHYWWQYFIIGFIYIPVFISSTYAYRNKYIQLLTFMFLFDIFLHLIIQFGITETHLYSGHWIYVVPLFLGWIYKQISNKIKKLYVISLTMIAIICIINNSIRISEFINLSINLFPYPYH